MKTLLIAAVVLALGGGGPSLAAEGASSDRHAWRDHQWWAVPPADPARTQGYQPFMNRCVAECPDAGQGSERRTYAGRARDFCEVRWRDPRAARDTAGETHDRFIDRCARRCVAQQGATAPGQLGLILGGVGAAALVGGVAAAAGGHGSSAPPASP